MIQPWRTSACRDDMNTVAIVYAVSLAMLAGAAFWWLA